MSLVRQIMAFSWIRMLLLFIGVWVLLVYIFISSTGSNTESEDTLKRLNQALIYLEQSKNINSELKELIDEYIGDSSFHSDQKQKLLHKLESKFPDGSSLPVMSNFKGEPNADYEKMRRRIEQNTQEQWNYLHSELLKIQKTVHDDAPEASKQITNILSLTNEHKRSLLNDLTELKQNDGYEHWRHVEAKQLSDLIQRRLHYLQNPADCSTAKKLVCRLNKGCGYGCQVHHVVYCFIMAYATERTLILKSKGWRYHKGGWEEIFQPVSETCTDANGASHSSWPGQSNTQVITVPIIDSLNPRPKYLPLAIPADLAPRMMKLHGDPIVWWIGQFLKFILKPQPETQEMLDNGLKKMGFKKPIVGVHVRRTDKVGTEAAFHGIEEYMSAVDDYYSQLESVQTVEVRRVFLASDDPKVIDEARKKYPQYQIIGDLDVAKAAAVSTRYTDSSLNGIVLDIHLLSLSDYLVCTFSSQVCRVAYEIMQTIYPDASNRFKSLDDIYYYGGQNAHNREAVLAHEPKNHEEIHIKPGDSIGVAGNHWNGFSKGKNSRTNQLGLFPSFKVNDKVEIVEFPTYSQVE